MKRRFPVFLAAICIVFFASCSSGTYFTATPSASAATSDVSSSAPASPAEPAAASPPLPELSPSPGQSESDDGEKSVLDKTLSASLSKKIHDSFGNGAADWYSSVDEINVFNNGKNVYYAIIEVHTNNTDTASKIGNAVSAAAEDIVVLKTIIVMNNSGIVFEKK